MRSDFLIPGGNLVLSIAKSNVRFLLESFSEMDLFIKDSSQNLVSGEVDFEIKGEGIDALVVGQGLFRKSPGGIQSYFAITKFEGPSQSAWTKYIERRLNDLSAGDLMTKMILSCGPREKIGSVIEKMNEQNCGSTVVRDLQGAVLGIFTERDVLKNCLSKSFLEHEVQKFMTEKVVVVESKARVEEIYLKFKGASFRHLPVVENGNLVGIISVRDLIRYWTKLLEIQSQNISKKYERAMSVIVHDLRSPIYAIRSINELVLDSHEDPAEWKNQKFPNLINDSCKTMIALIDDLLDMAELKSGEIRLKREAVDINQEISKTADMFRPGAAAKDISFQLSLEPVGSLNLDRRRIGQVLQNLISNAVKYTDKGGLIKVNLKGLREKVTLEIIDYGQGIKKEEVGKIFDEMCKISSTPTGNEPSTGLGLSITKRIVEAHGGEIRVASTPGIETKFSIDFPYHLNSQRQAA